MSEAEFDVMKQLPLSSGRRMDESKRQLASWTVHPTSSGTSSHDSPLATVFTEGRTHVVRHSSAAFALLTALSTREIAGRPLDGVLRADGLAFRELLDRAFETGLPDAVSDIAWHPGVGGAPPQYLTVIASPVFSDHRGERGLLVQILDTTRQVAARAAEEAFAREARLANEALVLAALRDQERAEAAVRESERRNALVEHLGEGIMMLDRDGRPFVLNPAGRKLLGIDDEPFESYVTCSLCTLAGVPISPDRHPAARALAGEQFTEEELVYHRANGTRSHLLFSGNSIRDEAGVVAHAIIIFRDVTALRALEETREEFVALISHDLRNPLHALLLNSQVLIDRLEVAGQTALTLEGKCANGIQRVTRRLASMVDELYRSSQIESATFALQLQPVAPQALIADLRDDVVTPAGRERVFVAETTADLPAVLVDAAQMQRALGNLVTNALKYSPADRNVFVEVGRTDTDVVFSVRDEGHGISEEDLAHLFEKYHRGRVTSDHEGIGLGLYITARLVAAHGGRISVESTLGRGSTFRISLPAHGSI